MIFTAWKETERNRKQKEIESNRDKQKETERNRKSRKETEKTENLPENPEKNPENPQKTPENPRKPQTERQIFFCSLPSKYFHWLSLQQKHCMYCDLRSRTSIECFWIRCFKLANYGGKFVNKSLDLQYKSFFKKKIAKTHTSGIWNCLSYRQSHYIEVAQGDIFMEQKMNLGWFWAGCQYWKKIGGRLWATFDGGSLMFSWAFFFSKML